MNEIMLIKTKTGKMLIGVVNSIKNRKRIQYPFTLLKQNDELILRPYDVHITGELIPFIDFENEPGCVNYEYTMKAPDAYTKAYIEAKNNFIDVRNQQKQKSEENG